MVDFGTDPDRGGKIVVKGKLVIEGKPGNPAYLAGSVVSTSTGYAPGEKPWAGVQVDSGAVLRISHARFYKAPAALVLRSRDLILKNCFFQGASALALPDTTLALNPMGQSLSTLDYREGKSGLSASGKERPGVFWPRVRKAGKWVAGGVGVLAVSGGIWWAATHVPGKQSAPPDPDAPGGLDAAPALPDPAAARP
jgi:hypothetical protein